MQYIVTGGGGFVGKALCKRLVSDGHVVTSVSRGNYPELTQIGVKTIRADLAESMTALRDAFKGADGVFHTAARVDLWGPHKEFFKTNVIGTRNVMAACHGAGIKKLVFTSSPSVIAGVGNLCGVNETYPYPKKHLASYPLTKMISEQEVRQADGLNGFHTITLRPHMIWGPGDNHLIPTILGRARTGRLIRVGNGTNLTDMTYIDDCAEAHVCAMKALENDPGKVGGKAYFISQGDPVNLWDWVNELLKLNNIPPITRAISEKLAWSIACVCEGFSKLFGYRFEPLLTRILVHEMATDHFFDITRAKEDLGYQPSCTIAEAMRKTFGGADTKLKSAV